MENTYCLILAGGIGSRFWPISTTEKPKQFRDFLGTGQSLVQMTFDRFKDIIPIENIFVITNEKYFDLVKEQLPLINENQILLEPARRNTAPSIAWGAYHIRDINPSANMIVSPSDQLVTNETEFRNTITKAVSFAQSNPMLLTLGIHPNRPETGYGYIQVDGHITDDIQKVKTFTEKPNLDLAKVFVESGEFLWNSGIFIWNVDTIIDAFNEYLPEIAVRFEGGTGIFSTDKEADYIKENQPACSNISVDFGIMEKASNVCVLSANFGWSDLGSWGALYEKSEKDNNNNVTLNCEAMTYESNDNIISLPEGKLAVIQGLENYIVAEDNDILLICKKNEEQRIRQFVNDAKVKYQDKFI